VNPDTSFRFPFGYHKRVVLDEPIVYRGRAGEEVSPSAGMPLTGDNTARMSPVQQTS